MVDNTPKAVSDCHELLKWLIPQIDKFARVRRLIWLGMWYRVQRIPEYQSALCEITRASMGPFAEGAETGVLESRSSGTWIRMGSTGRRQNARSLRSVCCWPCWIVSNLLADIFRQCADAQIGR